MDDWYTCVMGERDGDMVGESCFPRLRRCSEPGESVSGLMGAGLLLGEVAIPPGGGLDSEVSRRDVWMDGLLKDEGSWEFLSDAWIEGLLSEEERPKIKNQCFFIKAPNTLKGHYYNHFLLLTSVAELLALKSMTIYYRDPIIPQIRTQQSMCGFAYVYFENHA